MSELPPINGVLAVHGLIKAQKNRDTPQKKFLCPTSIDQLKESLKFKFGDEAETVFLLKEDVFVELGPPNHESVAYVAITRNPDEVRDGVITLMGPDITEAGMGKSLNFGQVVLLGGSKIDDLQYREMERELFHLKNLEGFMIRALPNKLWCRVSKEVGEKGFSFETLGKALMLMYKEKFPSIETMEILFLSTNSSQDFLELKVLGTEIRKTYVKKYSESLKARLTDIVAEVDKQRADCEYPWTCEECDYTQVCDEVRDIVEKMKAYREKRDTP